MTLRLRKFERKDTKELFSWFASERDVLQWGGAALLWPLDKRQFRDLIKQHRGESPTREIWAVDSPTGRMIGHFQLALNRRLRTAGLGRVALAPDQRGQGLSGAFMDLILAHAFRFDWVHRVDLLVYSPNTVALKVYQTAGFTLEGTRRETTPIHDEVWDTHIMSVLRYEFDKRTERE